MTFPELELGFVAARLETVIRVHGLVAEPVLWQIVTLLGAAFWRLSATAASASVTAATANIAKMERLIFRTPKKLPVH
jgi:hypothetical protein